MARLATASRDGRPHVVPICFALQADTVYISLDEKPKTAAPRRLRRVRNLLENPRATVLVDRYSDDWSRLGFVMAEGTARLLDGGEEHARAVEMLRDRYPQYRLMALDERPLIAIDVSRAVSWGDMGAGGED